MPIKPRRLCRGDTIALLAPSSGMAALVPHRLEQAKQYLESLGFVVQVSPSAVRSPSENMRVLIESEKAEGRELDPAIYSPSNPTYGSADGLMRARELMAAFQDPAVRAIVCTIGGFNSHESLEYLDFDVIRANPKIFCGFSDITTMHLALAARADLVSFYGPSAVCQFGEFPAPLPYTVEHFLKAVCEIAPIGAISPSSEWTDDKTANWLTKSDIEYVDKMKPNAGYQWLRPGAASGPLLGGCLPVLMNVRGTTYMPDLTGAMLLLETSEGHSFDTGMPAAEVNAVLGCLRLDGTFDKIRGIVLGRAFAYSADQVRELQRLVLFHTRGHDFPIVYGVDIGHTNPICTLPLGCHVALDSQTNTLTVTEAAVVA